MGLRNSNFPDSDAITINSSNNEDDAFFLRRELSGLTVGREWELIGTEFVSEFGLYIVFNSIEYDDSRILSITDEDSVDSSLNVALLKSSDSSNPDNLVITLPGLDPIVIDIPSATEDSPFQRIGIRMKEGVLVVSLNCTLVDFVILPGGAAPNPLPVANGTVVIFGAEAIVSSK